MIRRLLIPLLASGLLLAVTAGAAFAKCEGPNPPAFCQQTVASMDFGSAGSSIRAGAQTPIRLWVIRGEQPADEITVTLVFSRIGGTAVVRAAAEPAGEPGLWRANLTLPASGAWTVAAELTARDGVLQRVNLDAVPVGEPLRPPANQPGTPAAWARPPGPADCAPGGRPCRGRTRGGRRPAALRPRSGYHLDLR